MKNKLLKGSLMLLIFMFAFSISVSAKNASTNQNTESKSQSETIIVQHQGHGQYGMATSPLLKNNQNGPKSSDTIVAYATEDSELYQLDNNDQCLAKVNGNQYLLVDKIVIDSDHQDSCLSVLEEIGASPAFIRIAEEKIKAQEAIGNDEFEITVYAPAVLDDVSQEISNSSGISTRAVQTSDTVYYTYKGREMRAIWVKWANCSTRMQDIKGTSTKDKAKAFVNLVLSAGGVVSKSISLYGVGVSALQFFQSMFGTVQRGYAGDEFRMNVIYDSKMKEDQMKQGSWMKGPISYKAWLNRSDEYQYYAYTGKSYYYSRTLNTEYFSKNYNNAAANAYSGSMATDLPIKLKLPTGTYVL